ncbi:hypothetical protein ACVI1I_006210 [Bradyrhizobium sp. USDA 4459]
MHIVEILSGLVDELNEFKHIRCDASLFYELPFGCFLECFTKF